MEVPEEIMEVQEEAVHLLLSAHTLSPSHTFRSTTPNYLRAPLPISFSTLHCPTISFCTRSI